MGGLPRKYKVLFGEECTSSKVKPAKLACPPNSNVDKCVLVKGSLSWVPGIVSKFTAVRSIDIPDL